MVPQLGWNCTVYDPVVRPTAEYSPAAFVTAPLPESE